MNNTHLNLVTSQIMPKVCWQRYFTNNIPAASIKVVRDVNLKVDTNTRNLGNCKLSYEGGKYYIQVGADAGTKKPLGSGLESAKKIIYREIKNDDTTTYPRLSKTISANGNTITYICNLNASRDDGSDYSNEYSLVYETVHGPVQDWAGGEVVGYLVGCRFYLKNLFPNDYKNWTQDNFFFFLTDWNVRCSHGSQNNVSIVEEKQQCNILDRTYDTTTGELMFNRIISYIYESDRGGTGGYIGYTIREWQMWIIG